ncbi:MAG: DUF1553 domain-containing protein, partial [Planctomycetota bacterium]
HVHHGGDAKLSFCLTPIDHKQQIVQGPSRLKHILGLPEDQRRSSDNHSLRRYYRRIVSDDPLCTSLIFSQQGLWRLRDDLDAKIPTTLIWKESREPRTAFVLQRGQYDAPGKAVRRDVPDWLLPLNDSPAMTLTGHNPEREWSAEAVTPDRQVLADWLTHPNHPLTARVAVNRFWQMIFGVGLVKTSEDFGSQGTPPSHPELLDELALDFIASGWDIKVLLKQMVMSDAYQRSASVSKSHQSIDPDNRYLARSARPRLDAEAIRDQAMAISGLLVRDIGGPPVRTPQPDGLWAAVGYTGSNTALFEADQGEAIHRRSVFTFWKRTSGPAMMTTLDAPTREACTARRERTNTPLQALLLLNESQLLVAAQRLGQSAMEHPGTTSDQMDALFQRVLLRGIEPDERRPLLNLFEELRSHYESDLDAAASLVGDADACLAAWTIVASTLLNTDEVLCR